MTRKPRAKKESGQRVRRKSMPWELDRATPESPSSMQVLLAWLTKPGNAERWRRGKRSELSQEIVRTMQAQGIQHREPTDVQHKVWAMENHFTSAAAHLRLQGQVDAFGRGKADPKTVAEMAKLCPHYRELIPVFGSSAAAKKAQVAAKHSVKGAATATAGGASNGAKAVAATLGKKSAAGKWKESLEKDRRQSVAEEKGEQEPSAAPERTLVQSSLTVNGEQAAIEAEKKDAVEEGNSVGDESKPSDAGKDTLQSDANKQGGIVVEDEEEGALADVEDDASDAGENKETDWEEKSNAEQEKAPAEVESEGESSEEEQIDADVKDKSVVQAKNQGNAGETSSSEEEDSGEENEESQDEDDDGEEQIQLAQPDDETEEEDHEEQAERIDVVVEDNAESNNEDEADVGDEDKQEEVQETEEEEEGQEEPVNGSAKGKESSEHSDSSSSESESEGADNEAEDAPTSAKADSDAVPESQHESHTGNDDNDAKMEEASPASKYAEQSDATSEPPAQQRTPRKRRSSPEMASPGSKRSRRDSSSSNEATRDLERDAFIKRAKQEQAQRQELFELERSKLECELAAKQVQLAMEKALARKTLLSAGIEPAEVDRVLSQ